MPLVFVHGVATRKSPDYSRMVELRDALFKETALAGIVPASEATVLNPYWGGSGVTFAWNHACVPGKAFESFGPTEEVAADLLLNTADSLPEDPETTLVAMARASPRAAIDALFGMTAFDDTATAPGDLARLAARALRYVDRHPTLAWLDQVRTDTVFIDRLRLEMDAEEPPPAPATETLGLAELVAALKTAATRVAKVAVDLAARDARAKTSTLVTTLRPGLDARITTFVGDVFKYLKTRGTVGHAGEIVQTVIDAVEDANRRATNRRRDPIIVVAHSMGGEIVYDVLTHFRPDLACDVLVTVGSQVALFEEMKLLCASDEKITGPRPGVPKPLRVGKWINVYDSNDILSYAAEPVFTDVKDYHFDTGKTVLGAHSAYFVRPTFHQRLNAHLLDALR